MTYSKQPTFHNKTSTKINVNSKRKLIFQELINWLIIPWNFRLEKNANRPTIACIFLTKRCNSRCTICEYWKSESHDELSTEQWYHAIDRLEELNIKIINFTADGEIFTRKDAFEILTYAREKGFLLSINTNGLSLNRYIQQILQLNPLQMQVSLDAFDDELYQRIRGIPYGFTRVKQNILRLKQYGFKKISIGSVITTDNLDALPLLQNFCIEQGFSYRVTAFQFQGFNVDNRRLRTQYRQKHFLDKLESILKTLSMRPMNNTVIYLNSIKNYYTQNKFHPLDCIVGHYKIFILPNGDITLCNIMRNHSVIGNVKEMRPMIDIWQSKKAQLIRKNIKLKKCPSCWLSCFAEDNIRFSPLLAMQQLPYFFKKMVRIFR